MVSDYFWSEVRMIHGDGSVITSFLCYHGSKQGHGGIYEGSERCVK